MTAVSGDNAETIAGKGMTLALTRPEQKTVCASVLRQAEARVDTAKVKRLLAKLRRDVQVPFTAVADLNKLTNLLFPAKPSA